MENLLTVKDLNVTYINKKRRVMAVRHVSLEVDKGDSLGIVGESGSGKSTLAMALLRLHPKGTEIAGQALFEGKDLLAISQEEMNELRWVKIAVVFQKAMNALSPVHRISEQIEDIYFEYPVSEHQGDDHRNEGDGHPDTKQRPAAFLECSNQVTSGRCADFT